MHPARAACSAPTRFPATMLVLQDASSHSPSVHVIARSKFFATCSTSQTSLLGGRIGPGAGLLVRAAERVPLRERIPDLLGRGLSLRAQLGEIDPRNNTALHHDFSVNDHRVDV